MTEYLQILRLVLAGTFVALSALQGALYWSRRRPRHLIGALVATLLVVFIIGRYHVVASPETVAMWAGVRLAIGFLIAWAFLRVIIVEGDMRERWLRWCSHYVLLFVPLSFVDGVLLDMTAIEEGVGGRFVHLTPLSILLFIPSTLAFAVATYRVYRQARSSDQKKFFRLLAPLAGLMVLLGLNDTARLLGANTVAVLDLALAALAVGYVIETAQTTQQSFMQLERGIERRTAQLAAATRGVQDLLEGLPDLVLVVRGDAVEPRSQEAKQRWGDAARPLIDLAATPEDAEELLKLPLLARDHAVSIRARLVDDDGMFPAEIIAVLIAVDGEDVVVASARDLSEREQIERRLRLNDRLASVGTLAAGVAHEINNPLTFIASNIAYVREWLDENDDPEAAEFRAALDDAGNGAQRVADIVHVLRHFGRPEQVVSTNVDVRNVLEFAVRLVGPSTRGRAQVELDLEPDLPPAFGDDGRITQIIVNLVTNAAEAMPAERPATENHVTVSARAEEDAVIVTVVDNGVGMTAAQLSRVFDPFFTTHPSGGGMGLGLSICHNIAVELGGTIRLSSEVGVGTRAELVLKREVPS